MRWKVDHGPLIEGPWHPMQDSSSQSTFNPPSIKTTWRYKAKKTTQFKNKQRTWIDIHRRYMNGQLTHKKMLNIIHSVQFGSVAQSCPTLCDPMNSACQASLSITNSQSSLKLMSIKSVKPSSHLILCRPLLCLPPIPPSIRVFPNESTLQWGGQSTGVSALVAFFPKKSKADLI